MNDQSEKRVWITGAGKGIGRALSKLMVKEGWVVAATSRTKEDLLSLVNECPLNTVIPFPLDVSNHKKTISTVRAIEKTLGQIDLVILNAGTHTPVPATNFSVEQIRNLMEINFMGIVHGLSEVIPKFIKEKRGHIVVVASLAGYRGLPSASAYGASKAAIINMCEACLLYTSPSPRDRQKSRMPSSA